MHVAFSAFQGSQDNGIYLQNAVPLQPNLGEEGFWYDHIGIQGFANSSRPVLAQISNRMPLAWKGIVNDDRIFVSIYYGNPGTAMADSGLSVTPVMANWTVQNSAGGCER